MLTGTWLHVLSISNLIFLGVYSVEAILKITAQRAAYFRDSWNVFDFVCVAPAWVVLALPPGFNFGTQVMRIFRVLRVARFARRSAGVRSLLRTMRISAPSLANLGFLLFLVMFVFAIVGQQVRAQPGGRGRRQQPNAPLRASDVWRGQVWQHAEPQCQLPEHRALPAQPVPDAGRRQLAHHHAQQPGERLPEPCVQRQRARATDCPPCDAS